MLYSEFVTGTGCKETDHNYQVYKELEIIYMNTDCTKEHIYEMGRKLVDNSKSEKEIEVERQVKEEIEQHKNEIKTYKKWIQDEEELMNFWKQDGNKNMTEFYRNSIKNWKQEIKYHRNQISALKLVLA